MLAATYLARYRRTVQVIDAGDSRAAKIPESHNYPGFLGIAGREILRRLRAQAEQYDVQLMKGHVKSLRKESTAFVAAGFGQEVASRFVLLATGLVDHCPPIEGEAPDCPSEAIRFCPICDGYEATDRRIGVLGNFTSGGAKALFLRTYTKDVSLFLSNEPNVDGDNRTKLIERNIYIVDGFKTIATVPDGVVVWMENGACHQLDALYPALGCTVRSELATVLGAACAENGNLLVDDHQRTTVDALYAAGDVVTDLHQLSVAFGHAAIAATDIHNRLPANPR